MPSDHDLVDTGEMYLKAVLELEEERVPALRARLAERFGQSGPTVSQTVDRLRRNGLLDLGDDRQIVLTAEGRALAVSVMRKHRLAEVFLHQVVGLEWHLLHTEACRWEHVISDHTENLIDQLLGQPRHSPYGNPIAPGDQPDQACENLSRRAARPDGLTPVRISWIGEPLQADPDGLAELHARGLTPGTEVTVTGPQASGVGLLSGDTVITLPASQAKHVFVTPVPTRLPGAQGGRVPSGVSLAG